MLQTQRSGPKIIERQLDAQLLNLVEQGGIGLVDALDHLCVQFE